MAEITKLLNPVVVTAKIPSELIERDFATYWEKIRDTLKPEVVAKAMNGFRELEAHNVARVVGGNVKLYEPVVLKHLNEDMAKTCDGMLVVENLKMSVVGEYHVIEATGYSAPTVTLKGDPLKPEDVTVKAPAAGREAINQALEYELDIMARSSSTVREVDTPATETNYVDVACVSVKEDGTQWAPGTFESNRWSLAPGSLKYESMRVAMLGARPADVITVDVETPDGKIKASCTVLKVYELVPGVIDDAFAVKAGYPDLESMRGTIKANLAHALTNKRDEAIWAGFCTKLLDPAHLSIDQVPHAWVSNKAAQYLSMVKSKSGPAYLADIAAIIPGRKVETDADALEVLGEFAAGELVLDLCVRKWAFVSKIVDGPWTIDDMKQLIDKVKKSVSSRVNVQEE